MSFRFYFVFFLISSVMRLAFAGDVSRAFIHFLDKKQAQMTQAWADVTNSPQCAPMSKEEKQKLAISLQCNAFRVKPTLTLDSLDDLFFHYKSLQLKEILDCKKKNVDCYLSEEKELHDVADYFVRMQLANSRLFFKLIDGSLTKSDEDAISRIVSDEQILPLISKDNPCQLSSIVSHLNGKNPNLTDDRQKCIQTAKYVFKLLLRDNLIARQLDDFVGSEGTVDIFNQINEGNFEAKCKPLEIIKEKLKTGLHNSRAAFEAEENRIARSCAASDKPGDCFYKPIFPVKNLLINTGYPSSKSGIKNIEQELDPQLVEKYYCHLNRTYGATYDDLNETLTSKVIPYGELVFLWRAALSKILSKAVIQSPSAAITLAKLNKNKIFKNSIVKTVGRAASRTGDFIMVSGTVLEAQKLSQICLKRFLPKQATGRTNHWDISNCSCRNLHRSPITDKNPIDCQAEVLTLLMEEALEPVVALKDSLSTLDAVKKENLIQEFDSYVYAHLSKSVSDIKKFAKPEFITRLEKFIAKYNSEKYACQ